MSAVAQAVPATEQHNGEPRFQWCCAARGCGPCGVKRLEVEVERTETLDGKVVDLKTTPRLVSTCCESGLMMWDSLHQDFIDVEAVAA